MHNRYPQRNRDSYNWNTAAMYQNQNRANKAIKHGMAGQNASTTQAGKPRVEYWKGHYAGKQ